MWELSHAKVNRINEHASEDERNLLISCFFPCKGCFLEENVIYQDPMAINDNPLQDKRQSLESCRANCLAHNATYFQWKGPDYIHKAGRNSCLCANDAEVENKVSREDAVVGDTRCDGRDIFFSNNTPKG